MNNKIIFGIGGIVIGVLLVALFSSGAPFRTMMQGGNYSNNLGNSDNPKFGVNTGMLSNIDQHFIEQMIPHHDGAIAMAKLALQKANRSEIKVLAGEIIEAQNKEIVDMESWYKNWFNKNVSEASTGMMGGGMMSGGGMHMGGSEDMQNLEKAADFDKAFIEGMIPHHQLAIMMAQMLKSGTDRPEMLNLADNIIESQSREIKDMQNWYNTWYK